MNKEVLDILARGIFHMLGMDSSSLKGKPSNTKATTKPQPINARGQTNLLTKSGKTRDFTNPRQSAQRAPTLSPVQTRSGVQATPPKRPPGGFGQARGQLSVFGKNPNAVPSGTFKAPNIPKVGAKDALAIGGQAGIRGKLAGLGRSLLSPVAMGVQIADTALEVTGAGGLLHETFGTGPNMKRFRELTAKKPQPKAKKDPSPPRTSDTKTPPPPAPQLPPPPKLPPAPKALTRKELTMKKYDDLRAKFNAGKLTEKEFLREGLKMHKAYFNK